MHILALSPDIARSFQYQVGDGVHFFYPASKKNENVQLGQPVERRGEIEEIKTSGNILVKTIDGEYRQFSPQKIADCALESRTVITVSRK